jgi:hypothetical protein
MAESGVYVGRRGANRAYQAAVERGNIAARRRRIADQAIRVKVTLDDVDVEDLMGTESDDSAWSPDDAEWISTMHRVVAEEPWRPSLVRKGERPRVRRPLKVTAPNGLDAAIADLKASLKGKKGKSRILLKARIARLEALTILESTSYGQQPMPEPKDLPEPIGAPIPRPRQADYWPPENVAGRWR